MAILLCGSFHASSNCHFVSMSCHIWSRQKASLLCWSFHVCSNNLLCKCLVTFGAGKRHLFCVDPFMSAPRIFLCKCLNPFGAGKKYLSCVDPFISPQIIFYVDVLSDLEQATSAKSVTQLQKWRSHLRPDYFSGCQKLSFEPLTTSLRIIALFTYNWNPLGPKIILRSSTIHRDMVDGKSSFYVIV